MLTTIFAIVCVALALSLCLNYHQSRVIAAQRGALYESAQWIDPVSCVLSEDENGVYWS